VGVVGRLVRHPMAFHLEEVVVVVVHRRNYLEDLAL